MGGGELTQESLPASDGQEEKILVSVRLRPLNEKELSRIDGSDWECIDKSTIVFKNNLPDRAMFPTAYVYDKVFGCDCSTKQVYEEGAKDVALSVVLGINSTIFAYGQTSSGKTYTMSGITEHSVADIYKYIEAHKEREFVLKFSAIEIYNEAVRDLLTLESAPLRLLDDPEKGTTVEKLTEETLRDWSHMQELLAICEAHRKIGETSLNEASSRSHQILRLMVESSAREYLGSHKSSTLVATVNFVDLAGSERASQALSAGARLKEGCHINRSLLTLGTVIRKLSKGRNEHIPYRDSKLTRILQNSLGGNARTAIICTMSPAHCHVEQSRNTLLFASCAKEVTTNAQVNLVVSDKALVKQLQRELARLETELKSLRSTNITANSTALLKEKELLIEQMDKEIKELTWQRDHAQYPVENVVQSSENRRFSKFDNSSDLVLPDPVNSHHNDVKECRTFKNYDRNRMLNSLEFDPPLSSSPEDNSLLDDSTPKFVGLDPCRGWEEIAQRVDADIDEVCKEVRCIESEESEQKMKSEADQFLHNFEENEMKLSMADSTDMKMNTANEEDTHHGLRYEVQGMHQRVNCFGNLCPSEQSSCSSAMSSSHSSTLTRSRSCRAVLISIPSSFWLDKTDHHKNPPPAAFEKDLFENLDRNEGLVYETKYDFSRERLEKEDSHASSKEHSTEAQIATELSEEDTASVLDFVIGQKEKPKRQSKSQSSCNLECGKQIKMVELGETIKELEQEQMAAVESNSEFQEEFERQQKHIIELWDKCNVPLVHRTYFFLLFKGEPSDSVYIEVELRRLSFISNAFARGTNVTKDNYTLSQASSVKSLNREREMLSKRVQKKYSRKEREGLYQKWGIGLKTKQRSLQVARRLWSNPKDMENVRESAAVVAKLVGLVESGEAAPREIFGLSLLPRTTRQRSFIW